MTSIVYENSTEKHLMLVAESAFEDAMLERFACAPTAAVEHSFCSYAQGDMQFRSSGYPFGARLVLTVQESHESLVPRGEEKT